MNNLSGHSKSRSYRLALGTLALVLVTFVVIQGCANNAPHSGRDTGTGAQAIELEPAPEVGHPAPDFTLKDLDGNVVRLNDFRGKVVFINFWATWCPPCRAEMPEIEALHQEYKDKGVIVIGVDISEPESTVRQYIQQGGFSWIIVLDSTAKVARDYQIVAIPTSYFLDKEGIIKAVNVGPMTKRAMEAELAKAMR
jgi:peroxiredoxin